MSEPNSEYAVYARNVSKSFGSGPGAIHALKSVDFDTRIGELLMIVGPSGSGKTTLLSVIAGTLHFDSGEISVLGQPLGAMSEAALTEFRKINIGFIFQQFHLIKTLSTWENVSIPLLLNGSSREQARKRCWEVLEEVGLKGREYEKPINLSGGQQQRVAIARALAHNPRLIICDEPTSALDADNGVRVMELLRQIVSSQTRTVIVVTHDNRIFHFADRIVKMDDGKIFTISTNLTAGEKGTATIDQSGHL